MGVLSVTGIGTELLDQPDADPVVVAESLRNIARANRWFGGAAAVRYGLARMLEPMQRGSTLSLLDLGTGTGRILEVLAGRYERGLGLDVNQSMLAYARSKLKTAGLNHAEVRHGDIYNVALPDGAADAVVIHQVLHYAHSPAAAIDEASRVLAPGGRLLIVDFAAHEREELRATDAHIRLGFDDETMAAWFKAAGISVEQVEHLEGGELTVTLWLGAKAGVRQRQRRAA